MGDVDFVGDWNCILEQVMSLTKENMESTACFLAEDFCSTTWGLTSIYQSVLMAITVRYTRLELYAEFLGILFKKDSNLKTTFLSMPMVWAERYVWNFLGHRKSGFEIYQSEEMILYILSHFYHILMTTGVITVNEVKKMFTTILGVDPSSKQFAIYYVREYVCNWTADILPLLFLRFFLPECTDLDQAQQSELLKKIVNMHGHEWSPKEFLANNMELYKLRRTNTEGMNRIIISICNDDVTMLSEELAKDDTAIKTLIEFDEMSTFFGWKMYPLDFAALQGSVNCTKFLCLNDPSYSKQTLLAYAVMGGSSEIVRLVEELVVKIEGEIHRHALIAAIRYHRYDLFMWLVEIHPPQIDIILIEAAVLSDNLHALAFLFEIDPKLKSDLSEYKVMLPSAGFWVPVEYGLTWKELVEKWRSAVTLLFLINEGMFTQKEIVCFSFIGVSSNFRWTSMLTR